MTVHVSERFLNLLRFQLAQFADQGDLSSLVVYVAQAGDAESPALVPVGRWPSHGPALAPIASGSPLQQPADDRRWLPLRHNQMLLGALQVQTQLWPWPEPLGQRLQAVALCLTEALLQDLEQQRLTQQLQRQSEQLEVLVHQLRNPLTALRTFGQLLLRRLEDDNLNRPLVEGLLAEERQLNRYVDALSELGSLAAPALPEATPQPLLLPPQLNGPQGQPLAALLEPLLSRAAATAALQQRPWSPPAELPNWRGDSGAVAEIIANLLENAFRYSGEGTPIGLDTARTANGGLLLCVWDGGTPIAPEERERIFGRGERGERGQQVAGTGLGLALGRELARELGGELSLVIPPAQVNPQLSAQGNAFCLTLPAANVPPAR
ncbi:MAG: HAMP domain-containing sensor histidine kinase [Cyanobacteriota bacterium]|nr:HAMP domain-containing sensor histidine kinase [Cyanobacteriota bacterium]